VRIAIRNVGRRIVGGGLVGCGLVGRRVVGSRAVEPRFLFKHAKCESSFRSHWGTILLKNDLVELFDEVDGAHAD
jgi:hypothetical protein